VYDKRVHGAWNNTRTKRKVHGEGSMSRERAMCVVNEFVVIE
jgi:hypothetical protein